MAHRNTDKYLPEDLIVIGVDVHDGPMMDLLDDRIFGDLDDNLVRDINDKGVIQAVTCRKTDAGLEVIDGRRRVLHSREVNKNRVKTGEEPLKIPVSIIAADDVKALELQISLNTNRKAESIVTLSKKVCKFVEMLPDSDESKVRRAAVAANCSEAHIRSLLRFAKMDPEIHAKVESGTLGFAAAVTLSADSVETQREVAAKLESESLGGDVVRAKEIRKQVTEAKGEKPKKGPGRPRAENTKPSQKLTKDILFLIEMDAKARNMSYGEIPDGFADGVMWVLGMISPESVTGLQDLIERAESGETSMERKNRRYDDDA
jgi:ParB family chromosome partitioning protein